MKRLLYILGMLVVLVSLTQATDGTRMIGFDALTIGRGGTTYGFFDSPSLMMTNPAGISFLNGSMLDANFSLMVPSLHFSNNLNNADGKTNYFPMPALAYVNKSEGSPLTWGLGAFTQGGMGSDFMLNNALYGATKQTYHSQFAVMQGGLSAAYKITPDFSIGASAHGVYSTMEFEMPYSLSPSLLQGIAQPGMTFGQMFSAPPSMGGFGYTEVTASANMNSLTAFGFSGKIGLAYKLNDKINLGLAYTSSTALNFKNGTANMDMTAQLNDAFGKAVQGYMAQNPAATPAQAQAAVMGEFGGMGIDLTKGAVAKYDLEATMKLPQSLGFGMSYVAATNVRLAFDAEWINWSSAFDVMGLSLSNGANPNINTMMGNTGNFAINFPLDWKDSYSFRIGGEYDVNSSLTVRAGFDYGNNPVPASTIFPVFPAIVEDHISLGASYALSQSLKLNGAYELALNNTETASSQSLVANEYNNSSSQLSENTFNLSLSWMLN
jgi:long-chain fatty acid transport protein